MLNHITWHTLNTHLVLQLYIHKYFTIVHHDYFTVRAGRVPGGMIVLSRERTERSRTIPSFWKKNERLERVLKNVWTISKRTERELLEKKQEQSHRYQRQRHRKIHRMLIPQATTRNNSTSSNFSGSFRNIWKGIINHFRKAYYDTKMRSTQTEEKLPSNIHKFRKSSKLNYCPLT